MSWFRPIITYQDDEEVYPQIAEELAKKLPLTNLQWKMMHPILGKETNRVLDILDVDVKKLSQDLFPKAFLAGSNIPIALERPNSSDESATAIQSPPSEKGSLDGACQVNVGVATAQNTLQFPFLHLFLVACEDVEVYRATVRKSISLWMATVSSKAHQDWIILYVARPDVAKMSMKFLTGRTTVFDKLKADYGSKKVTLVRGSVSSSYDADAWNELAARIKESLLASFHGQTRSIQEQVTRSEAQRVLPGWNYCQYFLQKEKMSFLYETFNLADLALLVYDELEDMFTYYSRQPPAVWFKSVGGGDAGDDSADLFQVKRKPYRQKILDSSISIFDFRVYLFARQCQLLFRLNRPDIICTRTKHFLTTLCAVLKEHQQDLVPFFVQSFVYSVCTGVVLACEEHVAAIRVDDKTMLLYDGSKAELLWYARLQLDYVGLRTGFLPFSIHSYFQSSASEHDLNAASVSRAKAVFLLNWVKQRAANKGGSSVEVYERTLAEIIDEKLALKRQDCLGVAITNDELKAAFTSECQFDELYARLTERAIKGLEASSTRERTLVLLYGDLAFLHYIRKRYNLAQNLLSEKCLNLDVSAASAGGVVEQGETDALLEEPSSYSMLEVTDAPSAVDEAYSVLQPRSKGRGPAKWNRICLWFLEILVDCSRFDSSKKRRCTALVELLKTWCALKSQKHLGVAQQHAFSSASGVLEDSQHLERLVDELCKQAEFSETPMVYPIQPFFELSVNQLLEPLNDADPLLLEVGIKNLLRVPFKLNTVRLLLLGSEGADLLFSERDVTLSVNGAHSLNSVELRCPRQYQGNHFVLDSVLLRVNRLLFVHSFMRSSEKPKVRSEVATITKSMSIAGQPLSKVNFRINEIGASVRLLVGYDYKLDSVVSVKLLPFQRAIEAGTRLLWQSTGETDLQLAFAPRCVTVRVESLHDKDSGVEHDVEQVELPTKTGVCGLTLPRCSPSEFMSFKLQYSSLLAPASANGSAPFKFFLQSAAKVPLARIEGESVALPLPKPIVVEHSSFHYPEKTLLHVKLRNKLSLPLVLMSLPTLSDSQEDTLDLPLQGTFENGDGQVLSKMLWPEVDLAFLYKLGTNRVGDFSLNFSYARVESLVTWSLEQLLLQDLLAAKLEVYAVTAKSLVQQSFISKIDWEQFTTVGALPQNTWNAFHAELASHWNSAKEERTFPGGLTVLEQFFRVFWGKLERYNLFSVSLNDAANFLTESVSIPIHLSNPQYIGYSRWRVVAESSVEDTRSSVAKFKVGAPIGMKLRIVVHRTVSTLPNFVLQWKIKLDKDCWALQGPSAQRVDVDFSSDSCERAIDCDSISLVPLVTGNIPLPPIKLAVVCDEKLDQLPAHFGKQLTVIPKEKSATISVED